MHVPTINAPHLNRLFGGSRDEEAVPFEDLSPEEQAEVLAEEKAERVKFHRKSVRNGPVKWRTITTGQQRRQATRDQKALERKANRRHRRNFRQKQVKVATLRGQLQTIGVLPTATGIVFREGDRIAAYQWLTHRFGQRDDQGHLILNNDTVQDAVKAAGTEYHRLTSPAAKGAAV